MKKARIFSLFAVAALYSTAGFAQAGQFQPPTPDELKMTADPKAPGAAAVYLNIAQTADDNLGTRTFYARIKVLTEKGKELATVEVPYGGNLKVNAIKGRTIHSDGTVIPLEVKAEDLLTNKSGDFRVGKKVFTLPSAEVGSILEYRYDIDYPENSVSSPLWEVQRPFFVHQAHYAFSPFKAFMTGIGNMTSREIYNSKTGKTLDTLIWWSHLPPGQKVVANAEGRFSIDLTDIPAAPEEDWMPPLDSVLYRVFFYYKASGTAKEFWDEEAKSWSKEVNHFAETSGAIKSAVAGLVASSDTDLVKAKKLYDAVQALENTDYTRKKTESEMKTLGIKEAKRAEDTWNQKSGDSEDIAMLYLAMVRAAGLSAYAMKVADRSRIVFDDQYLNASQFRDTLVILSTGGQDILTDPGEKMCPFKTVNWRHTVTAGMRQMPNNAAGFVTVPEMPYLENTTTRTGEVTVDEHGKVTGDLQVAMKGQQALSWRQTAMRNDDAELKKEFDRVLGREVPDGVEAHVDHFLGMDTPDSNLIAMVKVTGNMGAATAKRLLLPGFFFESHSSTPFVKEEKREEPVDMQYGDKVVEQITYDLPAGSTVEGSPADSSDTWAGHARYIVKTKATPGQFIILRQLERAFSQAKPEEYQDLRGFYQKVATGDQQQLVLRASANAPSAAATPGVVDIVPAGSAKP